MGVNPAIDETSSGTTWFAHRPGRRPYPLLILVTDTNKWLLLSEDRLERQTPEDHTSSDYQLLGPIRQRQRRLTEAQVGEMATRYERGTTVCTNWPLN